MSIYASGMVCKTPAQIFQVINAIHELHYPWQKLQKYLSYCLTAVLARTLIFWRGMKPVRSASATTPIGQTECGSYPKTAIQDIKCYYHSGSGDGKEDANSI